MGCRDDNFHRLSMGASVISSLWREHERRQWFFKLIHHADDLRYRSQGEVPLMGFPPRDPGFRFHSELLEVGRPFDTNQVR